MNFCKILQTSYKNGSSKNCKFIKQSWERIFKNCNKKWYIVESESKGAYSKGNPIKSIESSLCDYSDAYVLVTANIPVTRTIAAAGNDPVKNNEPLIAVAQFAFKNCVPFKDCKTEINDTFLDYADFINIEMPMYNLIDYSDNYSDSSGSLWGFKRDTIVNNANATNYDNALHLSTKQTLLLILHRWNKKGSQNSCTTKIFR